MRPQPQRSRPGDPPPAPATSDDGRRCRGDPWSGGVDRRQTPGAGRANGPTARDPGARPVSVAYRTVSWNPYKKRYDAALAASLLLFLATFAGMAAWRAPELTIET